MKRNYGAGSGESTHYVVEVRCTYSEPKIISDDFVLDKEWRTLPLKHCICGVPTKNWNVVADQQHLLNYRAASAIAHWFLASLEAQLMGAGCIEARLVQIRLKYSYSTEEEGVGEIINRTDGEGEKFQPREVVGDIPLSARPIKTAKV